MGTFRGGGRCSCILNKPRCVEVKNSGQNALPKLRIYTGPHKANLAVNYMAFSLLKEVSKENLMMKFNAST